MDVTLERSPLPDGQDYLLAKVGTVAVTDCYVPTGTEVLVEDDDGAVVIRRRSDGELLAMGIIPQK